MTKVVFSMLILGAGTHLIMIRHAIFNLANTRERERERERDREMDTRHFVREWLPVARVEWIH
jgi:hypothetical protein